MAKKKAESRKQNAEGGTQSHGDASQKAEARTYEVGTWAGLPQWRCLLCGFDTLDEQAMLEHADEHKTPPGPTPSPSPFSKDENGEGNEAEVFEVELKEIGSTVDEQGNEHKTFTVKE